MCHDDSLALDDAVERILICRRATASTRSVLVAVTGIDGCGKGFATERLVAALQARGLRTAAVNIDGWLNLPGRRFDASNPAPHFYQHAIRFDDLFATLVLPLRDTRSIHLEADFVEETATGYRRQVYEYADIDVILLEGIYLLKRAFVAHYDISIWIDCTFETALERAVARAQEGLPPDETVHAYRTIYFPAQALHFERDDPKAAATIVVANDPRLISIGGALGDEGAATMPRRVDLHDRAAVIHARCADLTADS